MTQVNQTMKLRTVLIGWALALLLLLLPVFVFKSQYLLYISSLTCIYMIVACGLNIVLGYAGQISLAQAGFLGIGAYVCALLGPSLSFWVVLPLAGLICFVIGLGLGFPSLRVKTHFLAMVTLGFTVIVYLILVNEEKWTGGPFGVFNILRPKIGSLSFSSPANYHIIVALVTFILLLLAFWGLNSQWGRAFKAIRENEARAEMLGVNLRNYKLMAFAIGSGFAGIGGALIAPLFGYIDPTMFALGFSFQFLLMVVVGGVGRFEGPLLGAMIVAILPEMLRVTDKYFPVIFALAAILIMVFMPKGSVSAVDWAYKEEPHLTK
ncbi:MAG: branched-chain amino acid ABC transporter permease [candidate division NC10 bacterium]|nr:branched-chain amino acid ABC transporter permease [candidate division NC10 bacterium]